MKPTFNFIDYKQDVEIAGKTFTIDCSTRTGDYLQAETAQAREIAKQVVNGLADEEDAINYSAGIVDHVLGKGAVKEIFGEKEITFSDISDVILFLVCAVGEFSSAKIQQIQAMATLK